MKKHSKSFLSVNEARCFCVVEMCYQDKTTAETINAPLAPQALQGEAPVPPSLINRIDIWDRVCSPGPLMAEQAGARGNTIHADEQTAGKVEGSERKWSDERGGQCSGF